MVDHRMGPAQDKKTIGNAKIHTSRWEEKLDASTYVSIVNF
jgi:hypothetical protein